MTSFTESIKSTAIVPYTPEEHPLAKAKSSVEKTQEIFMERSFKAQIADYQHFNKHWMGTVTVLAGTSTAGKSSIIQALRQLEPDVIENGIDIAYMKKEVDFFKTNHPEETAILEKFLDPSTINLAVWNKERHWKEPISDAEKTEAEKILKSLSEKYPSPSDADGAFFENVEPQMFDEAFELSRQGRSVIFDVIDIDSFARHALMRNFNGPQLNVALVYCPFHTLSSRMEKRNQEAKRDGNLSNQRIGVFPLMQFGSIYTQKEVNQSTLETITREQATNVFNENFDKYTAFARKENQESRPDHVIQKEKEEVLQILLTNLGFTDTVDKVEIAPKNQDLYNLLINSGSMKAEDSAKILQERRCK